MRISIFAPGDTRRAYPAEACFDLAMLDVLRDRMVEVGPAPPVPTLRPAKGAALTFSDLARYLVENGFDYVLASVGVGISDGGHTAASLFRAISERSMSPEDMRVVPRRRLPLETLTDTLDARPADLLRAFLDRGAWICGEPASDARAERADLPMLLPLARMRDPFARRFLSLAA